MTDETKQPVVDAADTKPVASSEADGARNDGNDLDALLAEFETSTTRTEPPKPAPVADTTPPDNAILQELQAIRTERQQAKYKSEITEAVKSIRGDVSEDAVDDDMVEAWLDAKARKDSRLAQAWAQKANNPRQWQRIQSELGREFKKKFDKVPDRQVTEDLAAVVAAVRGASTKAPVEKAPELGSMSDAEFRQYTRQFGF